MIRDNTLKKSFVISFFIHLVILIPWPGFDFWNTKIKPERQPEPLLVFYKLSRDEKIGVQKQKSQKKEEKMVSKTTPKNLEKKKSLISNVSKNETKEVLQAKNQIVNLSQNVDIKVVPQAIMNYYRAIREEIKKKAYYYKPDFEGVGMVTVLFSVSSDGILQNLAIDNTNSSKVNILREAALKSVKYASPFPPFPPELKNDFITFSIVIEFELGRKH